MLLLVSMFVRTAAADCTFQTLPDELSEAIGAAEEAYSTLDEERFRRATTEVDFVLPCLSDPVDSVLATRLHRLRGLGYFAAGDLQAATEALQSARVLDPDYVFPESILPVGFELRDRYEALPGTEGTLRRMPRPRRGALWLDGSESGQRPLDRAALFQQLDPAGQVLQTHYLSPTDPLPSYPGIHKRQTNWLIASAGTAALASTLYGLSWVSRAQLNTVDASWDADQLDRVQRRTNTLFWLSAVSGVVGLSEVVVAFRSVP